MTQPKPNDDAWQEWIQEVLATYDPYEEPVSSLTTEQQAYYQELADREAVNCPDPDCICKK